MADLPKTDSGTQKGSRVTSLWASKRFWIIFLLFSSVVINYVDRINLAVAAPAIIDQFGWDAATMGFVLSAYQWSYVVFLIPIGRWIDTLGPRKVNSFAIGFWSMAAMLTGGVSSAGAMIAARLGLGAGEAATYPCAQKVIRQWFPTNERGLATSILNSGSWLGPALATPVVAWLVLSTGWRMSFVITGAVGFVWLMFWLKFYRNTPKECEWLSAEEKGYLAENVASIDNVQQAKMKKGTIKKLLTSPTLWGLAISQGFVNYSQTLYLTWLPTYLVQAKGFALMKAGIFSALPFLFAFGLTIVLGKVSDSLLTPEKIARGGRRTGVMLAMCLAGAVMPVTLVDNEYMILLLISLSMGGIATAISLNMALLSDLVDPTAAASALGILLVGANGCSMMAPIVSGFILKATGNYDYVFFVAGGLLVAAVCISFTCTRRPIVLD